MAARKRKSSESFKQYRANLKAETASTKQRIAGTFVHISTMAAPHHKRGLGSTYVSNTGIDGNVNKQF